MIKLFGRISKIFKYIPQIICPKMSVAVDPSVDEFKRNLTLFELEGKSITFSVDDLSRISDELGRIINFLKNSTNIEYFIYDYPAILEEELKSNVIELETILREIKNANLNIKQQKQQQFYFAKEKVSLKRTLKKLKDNEVREMETVAALFDKIMFARWENVKNTKKIDVLERFLSNITNKQAALENLHVLATRKLANLNKQLKSTTDSEKNGENVTSMIPKPMNNEEKPIIPPPPPLPDFPPWQIGNFSSFDLPLLEINEDLQLESLDELD